MKIKKFTTYLTEALDLVQLEEEIGESLPELKKDYEILSQNFSEILTKMVFYFKESNSQSVEVENKKYKPILIDNTSKEEMNSIIKNFSGTLKFFNEKIIAVVENARKDLENN